MATYMLICSDGSQQYYVTAESGSDSPLRIKYTRPKNGREFPDAALERVRRAVEVYQKYGSDLVPLYGITLA